MDSIPVYGLSTRNKCTIWIILSNLLDICNLHIPYTLNAAVILQTLHVLFGSIGMFLLLNSIFKSSRYAFIGAITFQFFGGFFSNAEHPDIVRAFAMSP